MIRHLATFRVFVILCVALPTALAAARFPKPSPEQAFREMKVFGDDGSPIRTPVEDWEGARQRLQSSQQWQQWLEARRQELDAWAQEPRDKPEYIAGWWHDFVRPTDGGFLEWTPQPPVDAPPKVFGGWVFGLRSRNGSYMVEAARLWRLTGEVRYFHWAAEQLDFYATNLQRWPIQTSKSKSQLMHQSLDDANMLVRFVETARLLEGDIPAAVQSGWLARLQRWIDKLFRPMTLLLDETFQRVHNIACWQRSAMAMAAIYTRDSALWERAVDGEFGLRRQVRDGITSDYFWLEQSLGYNSYVVSAFLPLFTLAGLEGRLDELRIEAAAVENLMLASNLIRFPGGKLPTPADTTGANRRAPDLALLAGARRVFPTHLGMEHAGKATNWDNLLDPPTMPDEPANDTLPEVSSRNLESSRFAVLREGNWQVFFHYGQLDRSHAQAEALNYEAHYGEIDVTHDAGTVGYGSPLHRGYYTQAWAHNVPVIDGAGQDGWHTGELTAFSAEKAMVSARQATYRKNASASRTLSIEQGTLVETTDITVTDGKPHRLGIILNVQGSADLPASAMTMATTPFAHWSNPKEWTTDGPAEVVVRVGGQRFRVRVEGPSALRVVHATVPDSPPHKRQAIYVEAEAAQARFRTTWIPE